MTNREIVITHLDDLRLFADETVHPVVSPDNWDVYSSLCDYIDQIKTEVEILLKEQKWQIKRLTPTEPNVSINAYGTKFYYCPHCQRPILKSGIIGEPRHCVDCGQAVKWE